jgi:predicted nucleotidyltransferase
LTDNEKKIMVTLDTLQREKKPEILRLAEMYGAHNVRIFGSVARGDNRDESDIDFLVEFDKGRTLFDLVGLRLDLQELLGATVEVVTPNSLRYIRDRVVAEAQAL